MSIKTGEVQRRPYLDGLRGIAASMVLFAHLIIAILPTLVTFSSSEMHYRYEPYIGMSPLALVWAGNFAVCIFFVLSGFVLSDFCRMSRMSFPAQIIRRYLRLALPVFITSLIACIIMMLGLYKNLDASLETTRSGWLSMWYRAFEPGVLNVTADSFYGVFVNGKSNYNANLWTMQIELIGSICLFVVNALFRNKIIRISVLISLAIAFYKVYYWLFAAGALLFELEAFLPISRTNLIIAPRWRETLALIIVGIGLFFGAFPALQPGMRHILYTWISHSNTSLAWHMVGSVLLVAGLLYSTNAQKCLGSRLGQYLGRVSFILYLIQIPIICSLTAWIAVWMKNLPYSLLVLVDGGITLVVVFLVSNFLTLYIDIKTTAFSRFIGRAIDLWFPIIGSSFVKPFQSKVESIASNRGS